MEQELQEAYMYVNRIKIRSADLDPIEVQIKAIQENVGILER